MREGKKYAVEYKPGSYIEFRKILLRNDMTPSEFFQHIVELVNTNNDLLLKIIHQIKDDKINSFMKGERDKITIEGLYEAIEKRLKKEDV